MKWRITRNGTPLPFEPNFKADGDYRVFSYTFIDTSPSFGSNTYQLQWYRISQAMEVSSIVLSGTIFKR